LAKPDLNKLEGRHLWTPERLLRRRKIAVTVAVYCTVCGRYSCSGIFAGGDLYVNQRMHAAHVEASPGCQGGGVVAPPMRVN